MTHKLLMWYDDSRDHAKMSTYGKLLAMDKFALEGIPWSIDREVLECGAIIRRGYLWFETEADAALFKLTRL